MGAVERQPCALLVSPPQSYRIAPYLQAAAQEGIELVVVSEGRHSLVSAVASGIHVDLTAPVPQALTKITTALKHRRVLAVLGTDDSTVELAACLADHYGLPGNTPASAQATRRKDIARQVMRHAGLPVPEFLVLDIEQPLIPQLQQFRFPGVVKPLMLSGSRGVIRVDNPVALQAAVARIRPILKRSGVSDEYETTHLLLERFISGPEYAVEAILSDGRLDLLAVFEKPEPLNGPFFEETYYIFPALLSKEVEQQVVDSLSAACAAYGLTQGPVHAEFRLAGGQVWIIEIASRTIGGQCARLLEMALGQRLESIVLRNAMGVYRKPARQPGAFGVLMIPTPGAGLLKRVEGIAKAAKIPGIEHIEISIAEGYEIEPLPEGQSYLGFIFARAATNREVQDRLRQAHACLRIIIAPVLPVTVSAVDTS